MNCALTIIIFSRRRRRGQEEAEEQAEEGGIGRVGAAAAAGGAEVGQRRRGSEEAVDALIRHSLSARRYVANDWLIFLIELLDCLQIFPWRVLVFSAQNDSI